VVVVQRVDDASTLPLTDDEIEVAQQP